MRRLFALLVVLGLSSVCIAKDTLTVQTLGFSDSSTSVRLLADVKAFHIGIDVTSDNKIGAILQTDLREGPITPYITGGLYRTKEDLSAMVGLGGKLDLAKSVKLLSEVHITTDKDFKLGVGVSFCF